MGRDNLHEEADPAKKYGEIFKAFPNRRFSGVFPDKQCSSQSNAQLPLAVKPYQLPSVTHFNERRNESSKAIIFVVSVLKKYLVNCKLNSYSTFYISLGRQAFVGNVLSFRTKLIIDTFSK